MFRFPWTNEHELNLEWLVRTVKKLSAKADSAVTSVNGATGDVVLPIPFAYNGLPTALGTAAPGTSSDYARGDHVHPMPPALTIDPTLTIPGAAADAEAAGNAIRAIEGELPPTETDLAYTYESAKRFRGSTTYTNVANLIESVSSGAWKIGTASVTGYEQIRLRQHTYGTTARAWMVFTKDDGTIVQYGPKLSGEATVTNVYDVPDGATKIYAATYSSDLNLPTLLVITGLNPTSVRGYIDAENLKQDVIIENARGEARALLNHELYWNKAIMHKHMYGTNGSYNDDENYRATTVLGVYQPTLIHTDLDLRIACNEYQRILGPSTAQFVRNIRGYAPEDIYVTAETYPIYIVVGLYTLAGETAPIGDLYTDAEIADGLKLYGLSDVPAAALSMFASIGVTGCSWDAGSIYAAGGSHVSPTTLSWGDNIARRNGITCNNYAIGGLNIKTWINYSNTNEDHSKWRGLQGVLERDADPVYFFPWGNVNDAAAIDDNTFTLGSISDLAGGDYTQYPSTFYGLCGRAIEMIQAHSPDSFILVMRGAGLISTTPSRVACDAAMQEIAAYYNLPYLDTREDPFYLEYCQWTVSNHPTAAGYSGAAMMVERLFATAVRENHTLFQTYNGQIRTITVPWSPVT